MYSSCKFIYTPTVQTRYDSVLSLLRDNLKFIQSPIIVKYCFKNDIVY